MRRTILIIVGILGFISGMGWMLQGLNIIRWPPHGFMVDNHVWILRGGIVAALSAILVLGVRLTPGRRD